MSVWGVAESRRVRKMTRARSMMGGVKRSLLASLCLMGWGFALNVQAQNHSSSSSSVGSSAGSAAFTASFGGHTATPPVNPPTGVVVGHTPTVGSFHPMPMHHGSGNHPHHSQTYPSYGEVYLYPVPLGVAADSQADQDADADDESDYQGGPTIFDRRGFGADSYVPPVEDAPAAHRAENREDDSSAPVPVPPTILVFKDQHTLEVSNYAIVGPTLFDLTPGHARRIALASLDLDATQKQNDDRGIEFSLPPRAQAN
jgi:hypothetical protein